MLAATEIRASNKKGYRKSIISFSMALEDQPTALSFRSRSDAWDWVEQNHPGFSIRCYDNPDGTVDAYLEQPPEEEEAECCERCKESPCVMVEHREQFEGLLQLNRFDENMANRQRRFKMYQEMTRLIHDGYLGKGNRKELPECVTEAIRDAFPNEDAKEAYVGFRDASSKQ